MNTPITKFNLSSSRSMNPVEHFLPTVTNTIQSTITGYKYLKTGNISRLIV